MFCGCTGSSCTPPGGSAFECTATPSQTFYSATITYVATPQSWVLKTKDGTQYTFRYETDGSGPGALLQSIADRYGNQITLTRTPAQTGNITQISSSNGRYIALHYNTNGLIDHATDNSTLTTGRETFYQYTNEELTQSTDLNGYNTTYTWYTPVDLGSITLKAVAGAGGLDEQTAIGYTYTSSGNYYQFTFLTPPDNQSYYQNVYTTNANGQVTLADIYDPKVIRRHLIFNSGGYLTSEALNYGSSPSETTTYMRDPAT